MTDQEIISDLKAKLVLLVLQQPPRAWLLTIGFLFGLPVGIMLGTLIVMP